MLCERLFFVLALFPAAGCNSIMNGWLDPTVVGEFKNSAVNDIRASLSLEDLPTGIPGATYPEPRDFELLVREYPISAGDTLDIEINELRQRLVPYRTQLSVSSSGQVNLPVVGRVQAAGLTAPQFEEALRGALQQRTVLVDPEVTVNPLYLSKATYSIFGIGVSASNDAPLRAGTFPIRKPDLRLLEAINQVGGLNEFVTEVYIFRYDDLASSGTPVEALPSQSNEPVPAEERRDELDAPTDQPVEPRSSPDTPGDIDEPRRDLLDLVERNEPAQAHVEPPPRNVPTELEPGIIDPYLYVDGKFVPNPAFVGADRPSEPSAAPATATITPGVNWARLAGDVSYRVIVVPAESLRTGDLNVNMFVRPGDVIRVVSGEIGAYYVMGQVNRVGPYSFNAEQVTLKSAIAVAGGLSGLAWPSRCTVYRRIGAGEQMMQVNLDRIFAGLDPDFTIKRGDIINVGTHPFAPFLQRIRGLTLPNPVANVGYTFTYSRNFADIDSFAVQQNPANVPDEFPLLLP